jgi:hypothetical protein
MFWDNVLRLACQICGSLAGVRALTWLVALFGSERLSKRAMSLLRRKPANYRRPTTGAKHNSGALILKTSTAEELVTEVGATDFDDVGSAESATSELTKASRSRHAQVAKAVPSGKAASARSSRTVKPEQPSRSSANHRQSYAGWMQESDHAAESGSKNVSIP